MRLENHHYSWHQSAWEKFVIARSQNHLPHALLITAAEGTGKRDFSEKMIKSLLCPKTKEQHQACGECPSCKTYHADANPDFKKIELLEGKQQISVDQIRQLSEFISYTRSFEAYRVVLINPVERMNKNAANSLLKSLEEPASNTVIILLANNISQILPTIKSRCQLLTLPTPSKQQALEWLSKQNNTLENPEELLDIAQGQPLSALAITKEELQSRESFINDLIAVCQHQKSVTETAKYWEKYSTNKLLSWQINGLVKLIKVRMTSHDIGSNLFHNLPKHIEKLAELLEEDKLWFLYQQLIKKKQLIHTSVNPLLFVESMLLLWIQASRSNTA